MAKQQAKTTKETMTEEELRRQVAKWVREALGGLVEEHEMELDQVAADENAVRYSKETRPRRSEQVERVKQSGLLGRRLGGRARREESKRG